jgi:uncharacterized damage-inducible protein DinB
MVDRKPPRMAGGERETLIGLLRFQRESLVRKVTGLDDEAARRRLVGSETTLLWLVNHLAWAEELWLAHRFAEQDKATLPQPRDTIAEAVEAYRATWKRVDAIVAAAELDDLSRRNEDAPPVNLRWILAHLLEETARHAGHADILRELIDGETGR